jgi:hypothetical protein
VGEPRLPLRGGDTLSPPALARLKATLAADDPGQEIAAAWAVKERLRQLLHATHLTDLANRRVLFHDAVTAAATPETAGAPVEVRASTAGIRDNNDCVSLLKRNGILAIRPAAPSVVHVDTQATTPVPSRPG